jgi:hypothetical protein
LINIVDCKVMAILGIYFKELSKSTVTPARFQICYTTHRHRRKLMHFVTCDSLKKNFSVRNFLHLVRTKFEWYYLENATLEVADFCLIQTQSRKSRSVSQNPVKLSRPQKMINFLRFQMDMVMS